MVLGVGMGFFADPALAGSSLRRTAKVEAIRKVQPCVVSISSEKRAASNSRWPFSNEENQRPRISGMGTGVILDERGFILTNQHVVDKVQGIEVQLADGTVYPGRVIQQDVAMDLAMLKVEAGRPLPAIAVGSSSDLMVGEDVITIGNAFGYENTVSTGIISALNRHVTLADDQVYRNLIQTDACINPGNSGGPLVNIDGQLIGINVAVRAGAQGIGFALPIDDVKRVATEMMSTRRLAATWHGFVASEVNSGQGRSVVLAEVQAGSPAEIAGFRPGDQLVRVGSLAVSTALDIERALLDLRPGQKTEVLVKRAGADQTLPLEMQALPRAVPAANDQVWRLLGLRLSPVSKEYVSTVSPRFRGGLLVRDVLANSPADRALIRKGDILVGMKAGERDWETLRADNILYVLGQAEVARAQQVLYYLVRQDEFVQGSLSLAAPPVIGSARR
jgi:serine protease Do